MTPRDTTNAGPPLPDCGVVRTRSDGPGVSIDKSVVEAVLDDADHRLVPDTHSDRASDDLLRTLVESFRRVAPEMSHDIVQDRRDAAATLQMLYDTATPVHVVRRRR